MLKNHDRIVVSLALVVLVFYGCAAQQPKSQALVWHCSKQADAAFGRGDWQTALDGHKQLLASEPHNCLALYHLGYIEGNLGDRRSEIALYQQALDCGYTSDDQLYFNLGMAQGDLGDYAAARKSLQTAVSLNPENPDNHFGLGLTEQAHGRFEEAQKAYAQAIERDPSHVEARLALARLLLDLDRWDHAALQIDTVLEANPSNEEALELRQTLESRKHLQYK